MGIDVWVPRGARSALSVRPAPGAPRTGESRTGESRTGASRTGASRTGASGAAPSELVSSRPVGPAKAQAEPFHLCFMTCGDASLVFSVPLESDTLPLDLKQFADDVALAWTGSTDTTVTTLKWPMVRASHFDQSEEAARKVVGERMAQSAGPLLLFGDGVTRYVDADGRPHAVVDAIESFLADGARKRALWHSIRQLRGQGS